jgi:hypothetical protein
MNEAITSFKVFIDQYHDGSIAEDSAWRAYDIERMVNRIRRDEAMRALGHLTNPRVFGYTHIAAEYSIQPATRARHLVGLWRTWARIASGEAKGGLILRDAHASRG